MSRALLCALAAFLVTAPPAVAQFSGAVPNDPLFDAGGYYPADSGQWNLRAVRMPEAWGITTGASGIVVAVIDDPFDISHPDLSDALWVNNVEANGSPSVDDDGNGCVDDINGCAFFVTQPPNGQGITSPPGSSSHGTKSAGVLLAATDNGLNVAGVAGGQGLGAPRVRFMPIRFQTIFVSPDDVKILIARAVEYAVQNGADVVSMSLASFGGANNPVIPGRTPVVRVNDLIQQAVDAGVILVAATGNESQFIDESFSESWSEPAMTPSGFCASLGWPASRPGVISVGAVTFDEVLWDGTCGSPDLVAPGGISAIPTLRHHLNSDESPRAATDFSYFGGTSAATPHVAGVAALLRSVNPALSRQEVESALLATADPTGCSDPYPLISCGAGRLDAYAALRYVLESHGGTLAQDLVIPAGETWDFEAVTLVFAPGKKVVVEGMLLADGTTFEASASGWGGIRQTGGTATIAGESLIDGGGVTVLGGTFTLDGSALSSAGIYASGTATTVYVQRGSLIDQAPGYGVFAENGAFAHIRYEDTLIRLSGSGTVRSRGAGTRVLLADGATGFQNQRGVFADLYGTVDFAGYPGLDPVTVELNATGLQSETAARVRTSIAVHRVLQSATHDVWGLDGSYTHADSTYWGNDVFSSNDLTVFDGDATFVIDPVVTVDPGLAAFGSDALRGDAPSANGGLYPSALGTDTVQGWIEAAEQAMEEGDAEGAVDASEAAIDRAATESETNKAWAAAAHVAVWLQTAPAALRGSAYASAWGRLEATALAARSSRADAPWALRALVVAGLARPDRGAALTGETQAHLAALRRLPERRVPRRQADGLRAGGGRTAAPLTHAAFADLAEIRLAVEAGDGPGARAALASLAGHDRAQAEVGAVGVRAAFPDLDVDGALDSGPARLRPVASSLQSASGPLTVGPNPTTGSVEIRVPLAEPGRVAVTVYDNLGRRVAAVAPQEAGPGTHTVALDLGAVPAGVYLVRVTAEMDSGAPAVETRRVVVAR